MPMDGMEVPVMPEELGGGMAYERQYNEYWPKGEFSSKHGERSDCNPDWCSEVYHQLASN